MDELEKVISQIEKAFKEVASNGSKKTQIDNDLCKVTVYRVGKIIRIDVMISEETPF